MRVAYGHMREIWHGRDDVEDLRVAAYLVAIGRVAASYRAKGAVAAAPEKAAPRVGGPLRLATDGPRLPRRPAPFTWRRPAA